MREMGDAVEFDFQGNGDLLFDFFGGVAGPLRDDLRVGVGDVGIGLDGQGVERDDAPDEEDERAPEYKQAVARARNRWPYGSSLFPRSLFSHFGGELESIGHDFVAGLYAVADFLHAIGSETVG